MYGLNDKPTIWVVDDDKSIRWVLDNGPGIPEEIADTLFLPLVTQREGGTGLGLSVAMQIAQQHGGTIEVISRPHRLSHRSQRSSGTQMRVLLPL